MYLRKINQPMHGELSSTDARSGVELTIYQAGSVTAWDQNTDEFFVISDIIISGPPTGGLVTLFCDTTNTPTTVGNGETIVAVTLPTAGNLAITLHQPFIGIVGAPLILKTANTGQVNVQVFGFIRTNPNVVNYASAPAPAGDQ